MKKILTCVVVLLMLGIISSGMVIAQEKQAAKKEVSQKFLTTWKKVGNKTKEIRSFKTEKATTVAGVRGAEAEDEALKHLYFKGGIKYPSRLELRNAIDMLEQFVKDNPDDPTVAESKYFVAQCYMQLGETDKARTAFDDIIKNHADTEYADYAQEDLAGIRK